MSPTATVQQQFRCADCNRRLADYVDNIERGTVLIEVKCDKCGAANSLRLSR